MIMFGNSVQEFYLRAVRRNYRERKARLASLKTREDALQYNSGLRLSPFSDFESEYHYAALGEFL